MRYIFPSLPFVFIRSPRFEWCAESLDLFSLCSCPLSAVSLSLSLSVATTIGPVLRFQAQAPVPCAFRHTFFGNMSIGFNLTSARLAPTCVAVPDHCISKPSTAGTRILAMMPASSQPRVATCPVRSCSCCSVQFQTRNLRRDAAMSCSGRQLHSLRFLRAFQLVDLDAELGRNHVQENNGPILPALRVLAWQSSASMVRSAPVPCAVESPLLHQECDPGQQPERRRFPVVREWKCRVRSRQEAARRADAALRSSWRQVLRSQSRRPMLATTYASHQGLLQLRVRALHCDFRSTRVPPPQ